MKVEKTLEIYSKLSISEAQEVYIEIRVEDSYVFLRPI
jgi:hypothetical protein